MNILLLQQNWFQKEWIAAGHRVLSAGFMDGYDFRFPVPMEHIDNALKRLPDGFVPDRIVIHDNSSPILFTGLEDCPIPIYFYSVDTHHHSLVHRFMGHFLDGIAVAQKDYIPEFHSIGVDPLWLPLWAGRIYGPSEDKQHDAVFVGTLNSKLNEGRVRFFEALRNAAPVELFRGAWWDIYPHARIVINQTVKGDLNFRVFESMMSGAALLTEVSGNGLLELFQDGEHLVTYEKGNVADAAAKIHELIRDNERRIRIGTTGRDRIMEAHLPSHRAATLLPIIENLAKRPQSPIRYLSALVSYQNTAVRYMGTHRLVGLKALATSLQCGKVALERGESLSDELALHLCLAAIRYGQETGSTAGDDLIMAFHHAFPAVKLFTFTLIRSMLNQGKISEAASLAREVSEQPIETVYEHVRTAMDAVLSLGAQQTESVSLAKGSKNPYAQYDLEVPFVYKTH